MAKLVAEAEKELGKGSVDVEAMFAEAGAHVSRNGNQNKGKAIPIIEGIKLGQFAISPKFGDCKIGGIDPIIEVGGEKMQMVRIVPRKAGQSLAGGLTETKVLAGSLTINALNKKKGDKKVKEVKGAATEVKEVKDVKEEETMNKDQKAIVTEETKENNNNQEGSTMNETTVKATKDAVDAVQAANVNLAALLANIKTQPGTTPAAPATTAAPVSAPTGALPGAAAAPSAPSAPRVTINFPTLTLNIPGMSRNNFWYTEDTEDLAGVTSDNQNLGLGIVDIQFRQANSDNQVAKADVTFFPNITVKGVSVWNSKEQDGSMYVQFPSSRWEKDGKNQYFNSVSLGNNQRKVNAQILRHLLTFMQNGQVVLPVKPWYELTQNVADVLLEEVTSESFNQALAIESIRVIAPSEGMRNAGILAKVILHMSYGVTFSGMNARVSNRDGRTLMILPPSDSFARRDGNGKVNYSHYDLGGAVKVQILRYLDTLVK